MLKRYIYQLDCWGDYSKCSKCASCYVFKPGLKIYAVS